MHHSIQTNLQPTKCVFRMEHKRKQPRGILDQECTLRMVIQLDCGDCLKGEMALVAQAAHYIFLIGQCHLAFWQASQR